MIKIINNQKDNSFYQKVQSQNHYYEVWQASLKNKKVIFINNDNDEKFIDYNTTYFKNKNNPQKKINYYLTELGLMINYFFYPKKIPRYSFRQLLLNPNLIKKDYLIISDYSFEDYYKQIQAKQNYPFLKKTNDILLEKNFLEIFKRLKSIEISKKEYQSPIRRPEKIYYLYQVIK